MSLIQNSNNSRVSALTPDENAIIPAATSNTAAVTNDAISPLSAAQMGSAGVSGSPTLIKNIEAGGLKSIIFLAGIYLIYKLWRK